MSHWNSCHIHQIWSGIFDCVGRLGSPVSKNLSILKRPSWKDNARCRGCRKIAFTMNVSLLQPQHFAMEDVDPNCEMPCSWQREWRCWCSGIAICTGAVRCDGALRRMADGLSFFVDSRLTDVET
jgi:hypothetical protein